MITLMIAAIGSPAATATGGYCSTGMSKKSRLH